MVSVYLSTKIFSMERGLSSSIKYSGNIRHCKAFENTSAGLDWNGTTIIFDTRTARLSKERSDFLYGKIL